MLRTGVTVTRASTVPRPGTRARNASRAEELSTSTTPGHNSPAAGPLSSRATLVGSAAIDLSASTMGTWCHPSVDIAGAGGCADPRRTGRHLPTAPHQASHPDGWLIAPGATSATYPGTWNACTRRHVFRSPLGLLHGDRVGRYVPNNAWPYRVDSGSGSGYRIARSPCRVAGSHAANRRSPPPSARKRPVQHQQHAHQRGYPVGDQAEEPRLIAASGAVAARQVTSTAGSRRTRREPAFRVLRPSLGCS